MNCLFQNPPKQLKKMLLVFHLVYGFEEGALFTTETP